MSHYALLVEVRGIESIEKDLMPALEKMLAPFYSDCDGSYKVTNRGTDDEEYEDLEQADWTCDHKAHRWDWWQLGGRYRDRLQVIEKPSEPPAIGDIGVPESFAIREGEIEYEVKGADAARKRDIDWERMAGARRDSAVEHWAEYEAKMAEGKADGMWRYIYDVKDGEDREAYIRRKMMSLTAYAYLLADGTWVESETFIYEPGKIRESRFEKNEAFNLETAIAAMPDDAVLAFVDYHN